MKKSILIVEDNSFNRNILIHMLNESYKIYIAVNGEDALSIIRSKKESIQAVLLDLIMPVMDGYTFLKIAGEEGILRNLPVIVLTGNDTEENEVKSLELGAWDFVTKPYNEKIIKFRLKNVIEMNHLEELEAYKYNNQHDVLTGLYNKPRFFEITKEMIAENPKETFVFIRFDINRFQLINSYFGMKVGDQVLKYIADNLIILNKAFRNCSFARIEADIFCFCIPYRENYMNRILLRIRNILRNYDNSYDILPSIGLYVIKDHSMPIHEIYDKATLASKKCKGNYINYFAYYDDELSKELILEQTITNEMNHALSAKQFDIYLQPQYELDTNKPIGAEALVRWFHPEKGMVAPGDFIPVFEKNGFITKMDYYVWEKVCRLLRGWIDRGIDPYPISVNVSRVNFYNPNLCDNIINLVEKYRIPKGLLHLELTESSYMDNPGAMKNTINRLRDYGFSILMDDFGSGYSSLNMLKNINVDIIKIDMKFLEESESTGRGENILTSIIRMTKWLSIPVIIEGVETIEQAKFMRSIGCDYAQGFFFAKPMPVSEYEKNIDSVQKIINKEVRLEKITRFHIDELWSPDAQVNLLFNSIINAVGIYELYRGKLELIRANDGFFQVTNDSREKFNKIANDITQIVVKEDRQCIISAFELAIGKDKPVECEYRRYQEDGSIAWMQINVKHIMTSGERHLFYGAFNNVTKEKKKEEDIKKELEDLRFLMKSIELQHWEFDIINKRSIQEEDVTSRYGLSKIIENAPEQIIDMGLIHPDSIKAYREIHQKVEKGEKVVKKKINYIMPDGDRKRFSVTYTTVFDKEGKPIKAIGCAVPIG